MKHSRTDHILLGASVAGFLMMSVSFLLMPFETAAYLPGLLFWLGLAVGAAFQILLAMRCKTFLRKLDIPQEKTKKSGIGIFNFGSNREAIVADNVMAISLAVTVLAFVLTKGYGKICYVGIAVAAFSFCMHCVLNGKIYFHVRNKTKIRQKSERKAKSKE